MLQNFILQHIVLHMGFSSLVFFRSVFFPLWFFCRPTFWSISLEPMNIFAPNLGFRYNSKTILCKFKLKVIVQISRSHDQKVRYFFTFWAISMQCMDRILLNLTFIMPVECTMMYKVTKVRFERSRSRELTFSLLCYSVAYIITWI